tara:strand:- start:198 stop:605 length:408 start_codon:yes stop_codon:yes gene_type:complete
MNIEYIIICVLLFHFIGDYVLQPDSLNNNKGKSMKPLLIHIFIYFLNMLVLTSVFLFDIKTAVIFSFINAFTHLFIDYITSRIITKMGESELNKKVVNVKEFDISTINVYWPVLLLGLDQFAHHFILIYSLMWLC